VADARQAEVFDGVVEVVDGDALGLCGRGRRRRRRS
jgi:hypothetical protein